VRVYGLGAGEVVVVVVVVSEVAGLEVVVVVLVEVSLGLAAGVTVSVFCSQAASSAAPANMHINLFIGVVLSSQYSVNAKSEQHPFSAPRNCNYLKRCVIRQVVRFGYSLASQFSVPGVNSTGQRWLFLTCLFQSAIR